MDADDVLRFLREHRLAVEATVAADGTPQAAVIGYGVSDTLEIVFDTLESTRKYQNLASDPRIALVVGWDAVTMQIVGVADVLEGDDRVRLLDDYFRVYPDGRDRLNWAGIAHVRVRPTWIRYTDYRQDPPAICELTRDQLVRWSSAMSRLA